MRMKKTIIIALFLCLAVSMTSFADEIIVYENDYEGQTSGTPFTEGSPWNWGDNGTVHTCTYQDDGTGNIVVDHTGTIGNPTGADRNMRFGTKWNLTMSGNTSSDPADYIIEFDLRSVSGNWDPIALEFFVLTTGGTQGYGSGASDYNQADGWVHIEMSLADLTVGWWQGTSWDLTDSTWSIEVGGPPWPGTSVPAYTPNWDQIWQMDNLKITQISVGTKSYNPDPPNGATRVDVDAIFSWTPGFNADKHDIYLGTVFTDVNDANRTNPMDVLVEQDYDANTYEPNNLQFNTTYYWRIDDVNDPNIYKGSVWSFTTSKEYIAEIIVYENDYEGETPGDGFPGWHWGDNGTVHIATYQDDGTGNIVVDHNGTIGNPTETARDMRFGSKWDITLAGNISSDPNDYTISFDLRSVSGNWDPINLEFFVLTYNPVEGTGTYGYGSGASAYAQADGWVHVEMSLADLPVGWWEGTNWDLTNSTWSIEVGGPPWPGTSVPAYTPNWDQIWQMDNLKITSFVPATSHDPYPENVAEDVESNPVLVWTPGKYADEHDVYFGTDFNSVNDANRTNDPCGVLVSQNHNGNYYPIIGTLDLDFYKTYYWRIDDVNEPNIYKGAVWSFTVGDYLVVDNFEDYNDITPDRIFETWRGGYGYSGYCGNGTGSVVGSDAEPWAEQSIVNNGSQSLPFHYDNRGTGTNFCGGPITLNYSEIVRTWDEPQDWTREGVKLLALWFRGYPATVGSYTLNAGTFTVMADGADIWDTADEFHFVYKKLTGTGIADIIARVVRVDDTDEWAKAGVMIRDSLDADSKNAFMFVTPSNRMAFQNRPEYKGDTLQAASDIDTISFPYWVRLYRDIGNVFTAYYSTNGTDWEELPAVDYTDATTENPAGVTMSDPVYIGLAHTSHVSGTLGQAVFSDVQIAGNVSGDWQSRDIPSNDAEQLYIAVEDYSNNITVINHPNDPNAVQLDEWTEWPIDLAEIEVAGVDTKNIKTMYIGVGNRDNPVSGGFGKLYIDDIRLHRPRCMPLEQKPAGDFNNDCLVDYLDLQILTNNWLIRGNYEVTPVAPGDDNLVAHYEFDGNFNDSSNGYHGEPNGASIITDSIRGQVASFDGDDDYVELPIGSVVGSLTNSTFATWVNFSNAGGSWQRIFDFGNDNQVYMFLTPRTDTTGSMRFAITTGSAGGEIGANSPTTLPSGWHHVVVTIDADNSTITLYLDGLVVAQNTQATLSPSDLGETTNNWLGRSQWEADGYFMGSLDDFRIYDRVLSHGEIGSLAGKTAVYTQPLDVLLSPQDTAIDMNSDSTINLKDYAKLASIWLQELLWP